MVFWQGNHSIYGHIRCIYTVLANPMHVVIVMATAHTSTCSIKSVLVTFMNGRSCVWNQLDSHPYNSQLHWEFLLSGRSLAVFITEGFLPCLIVIWVVMQCFDSHALNSPISGSCMHRVGQNRIFTPYMTVYMVIFLPKIPYTHPI
jgi:hypothetical protein